MSELQTSSPATLLSSDLSPSVNGSTSTRVRTCLVVSTSAGRAERFVQAARQERWGTIVCGSAEDAAMQAVRQRIQLALIDLETVPAGQASPLHKLVEQLAGRGGPLLVVCGRPGDEAGEVWSRRMGVWMYLPGVDSRSDIALVYGEARGIVEKLERAAPHQSPSTNGATRETRVRH